MFLITGRAEIDVDKKAQASDLAAAIARMGRKAPGCLSFTFAWDVLNDNLFHVFSEWDQEESCDRAVKSPQFAEAIEAMKHVGLRSVSFKRMAVSSVKDI